MKTYILISPDAKFMSQFYFFASKRPLDRAKISENLRKWRRRHAGWRAISPGALSARMERPQMYRGP